MIEVLLCGVRRRVRAPRLVGLMLEQAGEANINEVLEGHVALEVEVR